MKKCVIVPDSFKGTLSAETVCDVVAGALGAVFPDAEAVKIPVADGGEGTVSCFLTALPGARRVEITACDPYNAPISGFFARQGDLAVLETAMFAGLPQVEGRENPAKTSTYGVGVAMRAALELGCTEILLGLGGSCTNDGGAGMASALGVRFLNRAGAAFVPTGGTLAEIDRIDASALHPAVKAAQITAMCDVKNPLTGPHGAAHVFAPQKGADAAMVERLDAGLAHLAKIIARDLGIEVDALPGAGAAGGMGAGVVAFLGGALKPGIEAVLDIVGFDRALAGCDLIVTGEGRLDAQSVDGKVISGVAARAAAQGVPVAVLTGTAGDGAEQAYDCGVSAVFPINRRAEDFSVSRHKAKENLAFTAQNLFRLWKAAAR